MVWFNFLKGNKNKNRHELSDSDRLQAEAVRNLGWENKRLQLERDRALMLAEQEKRQLQLDRDKAKLQAEINELTGYDDEDDDNGNMENQLLSTILSRAMTNRTNSPVNGAYVGIDGGQTSSGSPPPPSIFLTDKQLKQIWEDVPKPFKKLAKGMTDEQIKAIIVNKIGNVDEDTLTRAITISKT
jgi:hypothetical protein